MNKYLIVIILKLLCGEDLYSQTFRNKMDILFAPLNKNEIPYNILYDRVAPLSDIISFNGKKISDPDSTNSHHFIQSYYEIFKASYDTTNMIEPQNLIDTLNSEYNDFKHPLGFLSFKLSTIDTNAIANNYLYQSQSDSLIYDVTGRSGSPYIIHASKLASLLINDNDIDTGKHLFYLDKRFVLLNDTVLLNSISINFNDGQGIQKRVVLGVVLNQWPTNIAPFEGIFINEGIYTAEIKLETATDTFVFYNPIIVSAKNHFIKIEGCDGGTSFTIEGYPCAECDVYGEYNAKAEVDVYYFFAAKNCQSKTVTNPVIFLDGFDPKPNIKGERTVEKIYTDYINKKPLLSNIGMADKFRADGYDIIIIDYKDGGDLMEKNALAVVKAIEKIYNDHKSTMVEDFVVIGPSMGANIAQYALAWMENKNIDHHTKLFISFDGPHQGANVPIGFQQFFEYIVHGALTPFHRYMSYDVDAAKQLLAHHHSANSESPAAHPYRSYFLNNLNNIDKYPVNLRKVAIINGSLNGDLNDDNYNSCDKLMKVQYIGKNGIIDWKAFISTANERCKSSSMFTAHKFLNALLLQPPWLLEKYTTNYFNSSYDISPGGGFAGSSKKMSTIEDLTNAALNLKNSVPLRFYAFEFDKMFQFTFIPTRSSIDYNTTGTLYKSYNNELLSSCNGITPFDWVYGPTLNEGHVDVTDQNVQWFENEIKGNYPSYGTYYEGITGDNAICMGSPKTYSIPNLNSDANVTWSVSSNLSYVVINNNSISVSVVSNNFESFVQADISNYCGGGTISLKKTGIKAGTANLGYVTFENFSAAPCDFRAEVTPNLTGFTYQWSDNNFSTYASTTVNYYGLYQSNLDNGAQIWVRAVNACGNSNTVYNQFYDNTHPHNCAYKKGNDQLQNNISIYPNPAEDQLIVEIPENLDYNMHIYINDITGRLLIKEAIPSATITINIQHLLPGMYFVTFKNSKGEVETKRFVKE